ncbi:MAG TPA: cyclophilin-like fold protein [bacterium]|nr:cyclophilin-like fold protein [bacterium]
MSNIRINVGGVEFVGSLNSSPLTEKLLRLLPYETYGETWGKEVYFPVDMEVDSHDLVSEVKVGDIAYWPDGPDICLFFGRTPKSTDDAPVVASPVKVIGTFQFSPEDFDRIERRRNGILVNVGPAQ